MVEMRRPGWDFYTLSELVRAEVARFIIFIRT